MPTDADLPPPTVIRPPTGWQFINFAELDQNVSDGVVAEKVFIERLESEAQHSQEVLDEDDADIVGTGGHRRLDEIGRPHAANFYLH